MRYFVLFASLIAFNQAAPLGPTEAPTTGAPTDAPVLSSAQQQAINSAIETNIPETGNLADETEFELPFDVSLLIRGDYHDTITMRAEKTAKRKEILAHVMATAKARPNNQFHGNNRALKFTKDNLGLAGVLAEEVCIASEWHCC